MGAFNILIAEVPCPNCDLKHEARIQFKFGDTWQIEYRVGDTIKWGGNDIGNPNLNKVKAYGNIESTACPFCNENNIPENYDIFIVKNLIEKFSPIERVSDYFGGNEEYIVLE